MEEKLNGNHLIPGLCLENRTKLIGEFKMAGSDVISIRGYTYILTETKWEFVRFGMDCDRKG